jgi:hypothetical protein
MILLKFYFSKMSIFGMIHTLRVRYTLFSWKVVKKNILVDIIILMLFMNF